MHGPIPIQLAIQGGGAKICGLAAAMEALQLYESRGQIRVTRIAGTSAGSIVGSLMAAGVSFRDLRARARGLSAETIARTFPVRSRAGTLWRLLRHKPLWEERAIRDLLIALFDFPGGPVTDLGALQSVRGIPVTIVASDLLEGQSHVFSSERTPSANLVNAVLDSCAVPFFLRTGVGQGRLFVDGGICENFPALLLDGDPVQDGPIVGIGFAQRPRSAPENTIELAAALLDTAMNSSMMRARAKVGRDFVHDVQTDVDTFDFPQALRDGFGRAYDDAYRQALDFFDGVVRRLAPQQGERLIQADPWADGDPAALQSVADLYKAHHAATRFTYVESVMEVQANSLCEEGHYCHGLADVLTYRLVFRLADDPVYAHSCGVAPSTPRDTTRPPAQYLNQRHWSLTDAMGATVRTIDMAALDRGDPTSRRMVLFFDPPLRADHGFTEPFTLGFRDSTDRVMAKLEADRRDEMGIVFAHALHSVQYAAIVIHLPEDQPIRLEPSSRRHAAKGRMMHAGDLARFPTPVGFRTIGWCGDAIPADQLLVVDVVR